MGMEGLTADNTALQQLQLVEQEAKLKGYSGKTIRSYLQQVDKFLASGDSPRNYLLKLIQQNASAETIRLAGFAIKFYLHAVKKDSSSANHYIKDILAELPNFKREQKLPVILSKEEIEKMVCSTKNLNHRLIIQVGYSAGLRVSEIIVLQWEDIDFDRNIIHLKNAKGKKDRIVMLSLKVKEALMSLTEHKKGYVFLTNRNGKYTPRAIQMIIEKAVLNSGIRKKVTPHSLRHSFATHLLENGTDIRYIKDLLGHADVRTTLIYTKVSNQKIREIKSPLDD